jgi:ABC-type Na+ transport system ATPase subunit NatA
VITLDSVIRRYGELIAVDHVGFIARPGRVSGSLGRRLLVRAEVG